MEEIKIPLDKWASNSKDFCQNLESSSFDSKTFSFDDNVTALGIHWNPSSDKYFFSSQLNFDEEVRWTKRLVLSVTSKLYDSSGWITPIIIRAKILMQEIWISGIDWDEELNSKLLEIWSNILVDLVKIDSISVPRWIGSNKSTKWSLHGFADASKRAFSANLYFVPEQGDCNLIFAKARVSPVKVVSIPKLELNGAVLLANIIHWLLEHFPVAPSSIFCWSDSLNVLHQLKTIPSKLGVYESHRVGEILTLIPEVPWRYVKSAENPADCATRGLNVEELLDFDLWWHGPQWLQNPEKWPNNLVETKFVATIELEVTAECSSKDIWFSSFSSLNRLIRAIAYCRRWLNKIVPQKIKLPPWLTALELQNSLICILKIDQEFWFKKELISSRYKSKLQKKSPLRGLFTSEFENSKYFWNFF